MALQIRRGTEAQRQGTAFASGELVYTTDRAQLFIGDGSTLGGRNVLAETAGTGLAFNPDTGKLDVNPSANGGFTTDNILPGQLPSRQYFSNELALDAIGAALNQATTSGIDITYNPIARTFDFSVTVTGGTAGLTAVSDDTTPQLGGNLDLNHHDIGGNGNIDLTGSITGGYISTDELNTTLIRTPSKIFFESITTDFSGSFRGSYFSLTPSRGTLGFPAAIHSGDVIGGLEAVPYTGTNALNSQGRAYGGVMSFRQDPNIAISTSSGFVGTTWVVAVSDGQSINLSNTLSYDSTGTLYSPIIKSGSYVTGSYPATPSAGMIIFDRITNHFMGYNGTAWVQLDN